MKNKLLVVSLVIAAVCWLKFAASTPVPDAWCVSGLKTLGSGQEQTKQKPIAKRMRLIPSTPVIEQVLPQDPDYKPTAYPGDLLTITGRNFAPDTNVTRVVLMQRVEPPPAMPPPASLVIGELYMKSATPEKLEAMIPLTVQPGEYMICVRVGTLAHSAPVALSVRTKVTRTGPIPLIMTVYQAMPGMVATIHGSGFGPKTVVRFKSAMSSQDAEFIDASTVRVRVPPELKPGPSELQVEVNYLPSAWFPIELERPMPLSLYWNDTDDNGIPMNPKWGWQIERSFGAPDYYPVPDQLVPISSFVSLLAQSQYTPEGMAAVTDWPVGLDTGGPWHADCGPHVNLMPATYVGQIRWSDHCWIDDDYCYWLFPDEGAGATFRSDDNIGGIQVEHDSDETIDHFGTTWWNEFHQAVDHGNAGEMIREKLAIVTALIGLDGQHGGQSELHPAWLMAIRVEEQGQEEKWAMFARNWGNEGYCGVSQHYVMFPEDDGMFRAELRLPWRPGATSVQVVEEETEFQSNPGDSADGPYVTPETGRGVRVTWWLPHPDKRGWSNGTMKLRWTGGSQPFSLSTATVLAAKATGAKIEEEAQVVAQMRAALPDHARPVFDQQISAMRQKSSPVAGVSPPRRTRNASRAIKPQQPPASVAQPDPVELERVRQMERALSEVGVTAPPKGAAVKTTVDAPPCVAPVRKKVGMPLSAPVHKKVEAQPSAIDISGQWQSNIGLVYDIRQSGAQFTWTVTGANEIGSGTLQGNTISASWGDGRTSFSGQGKIIVDSAQNRATRIEWSHGVIFYR